MKTRLEQGLRALHLSPAPSETLERYCHLLLEQNQVMNLTAITDPDQVVDLHILDSAALLMLEDFSEKRVIDVGTGAGFPGMVLKVLEPTIELTLLDSLAKRVNWLSELSTQLGVSPVDLRILAELCLPFVKVGGRFLAMKSDHCQEEVEHAGRAISKLGGQLRTMAQYQIPGTEITRRVVIVEKVRPTPNEYPRRFSRIKKTPL